MIDKLKYVVKEICKGNNDNACVVIIENSNYSYNKLGKHYHFDPHTYYILFKVVPSIYIKHVNDINRIVGIIEHYMNLSLDRDVIRIKKVEVKLDYEKLTILNSEISIIQTPWEEINFLQEKLINSIKISNSSIDFQNIGNSSRTTMNKLSQLVFNPQVHISQKAVDLSNGKFKNQLHTYITHVLNGNENKELRQFSESAISFVENAVDLMNQTTHKLDVQKHFAEVCVISTISVVSLIKAISEIEKTATNNSIANSGAGR